MKRRLQALSFNKRRHCFQFTFLTTDREIHEGHILTRDTSLWLMAAAGMSIRQVTWEAFPPLFGLVLNGGCCVDLTGWLHVSRHGWQLHVFYKNEAHNEIRQFILQVISVLQNILFYHLAPACSYLLLGYITRLNLLLSARRWHRPSVAADVRIILGKLLLKLVPMDTNGTAAEMERGGGASWGNKTTTWPTRNCIVGKLSGLIPSCGMGGCSGSSRWKASFLPTFDTRLIFQWEFLMCLFIYFLYSHILTVVIAYGCEMDKQPDVLYSSLDRSHPNY